MDVSTSTSAESQIDFDLLTSQWIPTDKPLQIIISKDSSTNTIKEGKETFVHVVIESLKDHINSLENQFKDKQEIIHGLFNLNSSQCFCNPAYRNYQEQKLAQNVKGLHTSTIDITKADISTDNDEDALTTIIFKQLYSNIKQQQIQLE